MRLPWRYITGIANWPLPQILRFQSLEVDGEVKTFIVSTQSETVFITRSSIANNSLVTRIAICTGSQGDVTITTRSTNLVSPGREY